MGFSQLLRSVYSNEFKPINTRQIALPVATSVTLTANAAGSTYGIWVDIALLATITKPTLVVGVLASVPSATDEFTIDIGITQPTPGGTIYATAAAVTAAGLAATAHRSESRVWARVVGAGGGGATDFIEDEMWHAVPLLNPVYVPANVGIIGRVYGITAAAVTIHCSVICLQNFS